MTEIDANAFINEEIQSRYRTAITDAVRSDWIRQLRSLDVQTARRIVHEIVDDPKGRLTIKEFRAKHPTATHPPKPYPPAYRACVRCLFPPPDHPDWEDQQWDGQYQSPHCAGDKGAIQILAEQAAAEHQQQYGGKWCGVVRAGDDSDAADAAQTTRADLDAVREHILNGPDGPVKRFLERVDSRKLLPAVVRSATPDFAAVMPKGET